MSLAYSTMLAYNAPFCGGMGTSNEPYLICTPEDLMEIKNNLNSYYKLKNDINLQNIEWISIGNETHPFKGNLDGDGYKILNLKLNTDERFSGLFGVSEGTISNLDLINVNVTGGQETGSLVGRNLGLIKEIYVTGEIKGSSEVGGLVGSNAGIILNSKTDVIVEGKEVVGGLIGYNNGVYKNEGIIRNCSSTGESNGGETTGGLIGFNNKGNEISNSYSINLVEGNDRVGGLIGSSDKSNISNSYFIGKVKGQNFVGGFIGKTNSNIIIQSYTNLEIIGEDNVGGFIGSSNGDKIDKSHSTGSVIGNQYVGGFIGYVSRVISKLPNNTYKTTNAEITKSYINSNVIGKKFVGGFIGEVNKGDIKNSYSTGSVKGDYYVGGFVGIDGDVKIMNSYTTIKVDNDKTDGFYGNSFFSEHNSNVTNSFYDKNIIPHSNDKKWSKTTEEMKDIKTYSNAGWDIEYTNIDKNNGYPFLAWEENIEGVWLIYTPNIIIEDEINYENENKIIDNANWDYILLGIGVLVVLIVIFVIGVKYLKNK